MQTVLRVLALVCATTVLGCSDDPAGPNPPETTYTLESENGDPVPSDPSAPDGCCLTLNGTLVLFDDTYEVVTHHRNKNTQGEFENSEQGTWTQAGNTITFTRVSGGGEGFPYLFGPGQLSDNGARLTVPYGDEGPGSDQIIAVYRRD